MHTVVEVTGNHSAFHSLPAEAPGRRSSHKGPGDTVSLQTLSSVLIGFLLIASLLLPMSSVVKKSVSNKVLA